MYRFFVFILSSILFFTVFIQCQESSTQTSVNKGEENNNSLKSAETKETIEKDTLELSEATVVPKVQEEKDSIINQAPLKSTASNTSEKTEKLPRKKKKRAKIKFSKTTYQFGKIKEGEKVNYAFQFKNTGDAPLVIKNVDVSCGCTFPSYPFIPIKPGKKGEIEVTFNSEHKVGRQKPTVTVITNGRPRTTKLYLEGIVE